MRRERNAGQVFYCRGFVQPAVPVPVDRGFLSVIRAMRSLVYFVATSLDGFVARPDGSIDWLFTEGEYGFAEWLASVDTVLQGRKTYEKVLSFGLPTWPYLGTETIVFTSQPERLPPPPPGANVRYEVESAPRLVRRLKQQPGRNIWLDGGGELAGSLARAGVLDELRVFVHPIWLGEGISLFGSQAPELRLELLGHHAFPDGLLALRYRVMKNEENG
ncbi:MAG TPA: dihydrofolate reductase family protein [bacterium]|nr:dihydrofolate reductase family protein [bacterium]